MNAIYPSLKGKMAFISGGASGIGASIVRLLAAQGVDVAFVDLNEEAAQDLRETCKGLPGKIDYATTDLRDIPALQQTIKDLRAKNRSFDILINNAAHDQRHKIDEVTPEYWDDHMAVNLRHQFFCAQALYPDMEKKGGGVIVNMGSSTYLVGQGGMPAYSAAKAAVYGLTRSLARDLGVKNIRVHCIVPGWILTDRQQELWLNEESEAELMQRQAIKQKLYPDDLAKIVLFFCADDSMACTGQMYIADGGWI
ncbi:MAG: SDR family oxidoreductase [Pseudomonadota bacterium]